jgi:hypothetical protein
VTAPTEYGTAFCDLQTLAEPVIATGGAGRLLTARQRAVPVPHVPTAETQTLPVVKAEEMLTVMDVPVLEVIAIPAGTVQEYEVAPATAEIE